MKSSLLLLLVPAAILAGCNRADTPERSDMREAPMSAPSPGADTGEFRDPARSIDQNGNAVVIPNSEIEGTNTSRPDGGSADDARRNQ
ncbi:MAG TPA: hypothetical protein VNQ32_15655 [Steroidobacteraceae bacterium]|nr:hypothetical protein [Steroidobacteraceae bacterium]